MRVLIMGASQGIGLETTRQAIKAGHQVRAFARSAPAMPLADSQLEKVRGDALNNQDVDGALKDIDVVIQTLGVALGDLFRPVHLFSATTRLLIDAMRARRAQTVSLRDRLWSRRQPREHQLATTTGIPDCLWPGLCR